MPIDVVTRFLPINERMPLANLMAPPVFSRNAPMITPSIMINLILPTVLPKPSCMEPIIKSVFMDVASPSAMLTRSNARKG